MIKHTVIVDRPQAEIFAIYKDVDSWAAWDPDIESVGLNGPFAVGTTGWLKPVGAPRTATRLISINEPEGFTVASKLPLCTMSFIHELQESAGGTSVTHSVTFTGVLAPLFSRLIGSKIQSGMAASMLGLKQYAEER